MLLPTVEMDNCLMHSRKSGYNVHMNISRDDTSSSIAFFNYALVDIVTNSIPCLAICNCLAIFFFFAIKKRTRELVA